MRLTGGVLPRPSRAPELLCDDAAPNATPRRLRVLLVLVLLTAVLLRLPGLTRAPPGLHQDEAANAWNAWCLLRTGADQVGARWPIFCYRALGEYRSALFLYVLMPFQLLGGLGIWTTRLPAALGGVATVALLYWVGRRLFGPATGLAAAALLAISPAHVQMSRWGHEASLAPLLALLPLAAWLWAGLPLDARDGRSQPLRALLAGLLTGICCYGYPAVRLFVPVFLAASMLVTWRAWRALWRTPRGRLTLGGLALGLAVTLGPLAYMHMAHPETIGRRGQMTWVWVASDPPGARVQRVLERYAAHFGPEFLFRSGDADEICWTAAFGYLPGYMLPLMLIGLACLIGSVRRSRAARVLLAGVLLYPVGDALNWHVSMHGLRSAVGLFALVLLAAVGLTGGLTLLSRARLRAARLAAAVGLAGLVVHQQAAFFYSYFVTRQTQLPVYEGNHVALVEACTWLRPRLAAVDAVVCTEYGMNQPYLIMLLALNHDPRRWFAEPIEMQPTASWDRYTRCGPLYFPSEPERRDLLQHWSEQAAPRRVILLLRPGESHAGRLVHTITGPDGKPALRIYDLQIGAAAASSIAAGIQP